MCKINFKGFTLIELLIVVAIIAILAAIAIPNFLAAQTRSKVSRAKGELSTVNTALESYYVDNTYYPLTTPWPGDPTDPPGIIPKQLSTPIAYLSRARPYDPFKQYGTRSDEEIYSYHNIRELGWSQTYLIAYGEWRMCSIGPDGDYWNGPYATSGCPYDPTNGTISYGNIWIGQKGKFDCQTRDGL
jgi:type II secretion system protein G